MTFVKYIVRYPIKGLNGEFVNSANLSPGSTISGDRKYAFAKSENDICEKSLIYMKKTNFLALVKEEKLSLLQPQINFKNEFLRLIYKDKEIFNGFLNNNNDIKKLNLCLAKFLNINIKKKPRLVKDKSDVKDDNKHSFSDIPDKALSFINLNSINDFEVKIKQEVNYNRFRGNVIFSGIKAWEEFNWLGKIITIGGVKFEIFRKTKRCAATNVNPNTGLRDLNIPNQLQKIYGHYDLGVYGKVLNKGIIKINDEIKF
ncbi:MOSC domain-containing protein [Alphaproteobacteria bacterium]|nr:MOSC domain-containing protein [Alphaproteobacteria bacterium]